MPLSSLSPAPKRPPRPCPSLHSCAGSLVPLVQPCGTALPCLKPAEPICPTDTAWGTEGKRATVTQSQQQFCSHTKSSVKFPAGSDNQNRDACFIPNAPAERGAGDPVLLWVGGKSGGCGQGESRGRGRSPASHASHFTFLPGREQQRQPSAPWKKVSACSSHRAAQLAEDSSGRGTAGSFYAPVCSGCQLGGI